MKFTRKEVNRISVLFKLNKTESTVVRVEMINIVKMKGFVCFVFFCFVLKKAMCCALQESILFVGFCSKLQVYSHCNKRTECSGRAGGLDQW